MRQLAGPMTVIAGAAILGSIVGVLLFLLLA